MRKISNKKKEMTTEMRMMQCEMMTMTTSDKR